MEFTYDAYKNMISMLKDNGYTITNYVSYEDCDKPVILRHDIDYSLSKSLELARVENEIGVKSTYFVMISSDFYNTLSEKSISTIRKIHDLGHEIGLHFDEVKYHYDENHWECKIKEDILNEISILENCINISISSVSMHRPSKKTLNSDLKIDGVINSYGKMFFDKFKYISDSRRRWRENLENTITSGEFDKLHILTHAFWYNEEELDIHQSVRDFINMGNEDRYNIMNDNITNLDEIMERREMK